MKTIITLITLMNVSDEKKFVLLSLTVLQKESYEVIQKENLLVPTFCNTCDNPDDIGELPHGYGTYIQDYPKLPRPEK